MEMTEPQYASLNVTIAGQNGDLPDQVLFDLSDTQIRAMAAEAVRSGGIRGVDAREADFTDFVVDRVAAHDGLPHRLLLRPKTPFGKLRDADDQPPVPGVIKLSAIAEAVKSFGGHVEAYEVRERMDTRIEVTIKASFPQ